MSQVYGRRPCPRQGTGEVLAHAQQQPAVAFLQPGVVVAFGSEAAVRRAIDLSTNSGASVLSNTEIMDQIAKLDDGNIWAVGRFDALSKTAKLPEQMAIQIPAIS